MKLRMIAWILIGLSCLACADRESRQIPQDASEQALQQNESSPSTADSSGGYSLFRQRLSAGAGCDELFDIRNSVEPKSLEIATMNNDLRQIGCYSRSSVRSTDAQLSGQSKQATGLQSETGAFTVNEYRMYRDIINTPMSVTEEKALQNASQKFGVSVEQIREDVRKVQAILFRNKWMGTPQSEIRHASDWNGETP